MMNNINIIATSLIFICLFSGTSSKQAFPQADDPWKAVDTILRKIKKPLFPNRIFNISDYGAVNDGRYDCSIAFDHAIKDCHASGGGRVLVPAGRYFTGPIYLKSHVELHLEKGAEILFSTNSKDYLPLVHTRWEGIDLMNYSPLIYAYHETDIGITGQGKLNGQASEHNWWTWKGNTSYGWREDMPNQNDSARSILFDMGERETSLEDRKFGEGFYLRPQFFQPYYCNNVLIDSVTFVQSPMWILHPVLCNSVTITNVRVESHGPNSDGCDPESCKDVLIKNCYFNTGDDCIALKSGRNAEGRKMNIPCENIVIQNCTMANGHGGVVIGSEISGGARNIYAENCYMSSPALERAIRIKTSSNRGGTIENLFFRNIKVGQVKEHAIIATMFYEDSGSYVPVIRNIRIENMSVERGGKYGILLEGYPDSPVRNVRISHCTINKAEIPYQFTNTKDLVLKDVRINGKNIK